MFKVNYAERVNKARSIMYFIVASVLSLSCTASYAEKSDLPAMKHSTALYVTPERCVALHKGQMCYLEVEFEWQAPEVGTYCLYNKTLNQKMNCWQSQKSGQFYLDFQAAEDHQFSLREGQSNVELAVAKITVAWVYKSSKRAKSSWRLF
ncbi:DUF3019 domain-containing protein [Thalassotalea fusca]